MKFITHVSAKVRETWERMVPPTRFQKGQVLFYQGHLPYGVFVVHQGKLRLKRTRGKRPAAEVGPGSMIGLELLEKEGPYPATAIVEEDLTVSFVDKTVLKKWLDSGKFKSLWKPEPP